VHAARVPEVTQSPMAVPVYRTATWSFDSAGHTADVFAGRTPGWSYSRSDNPTAQAFADAIARLEDHSGTAAGQPFASGTAATATVLVSLCSSGSRVVAPREVYGGTWSVLTRQLARFGVETEFVDMTDVSAVRAALRRETALLWAETLANPSMTVADLPALSEAAREAGVPLVVDSTFASPVVCRPLEHGADLVLHSATKYLGGHSDATGGVVVGRPDLVEQVRRTRHDLGGALAPDEAFLLLRGLQTLPLRVARQCESALVLATALAKHPAVARVDHPGLTSHRDHDLARKLFDQGRFGAVVTVTPHGGREAGLGLVDRLRLVKRATSLGGSHSNAVHIATTTHKDMDDASLRAAGIDPGSVRLSVGLEDAEDLLADVLAALSAP